ncbi:hypothetical protein DYB37_007939 [Aphanomyces astaci]|uniref:Uncharacterized protein n=1 Tax=Aphanomyces astaci TaxID=112090 RepID=A0A418DTC9_APHAT|nr:hypothetical protein DYB35_007336 [Aphanomyces astaci]RHZ15760.1 hypothetical protein DYB37_007939 [Aphanomyces astaci]
MATHCAQLETATSIKGLGRAYKVLLNDCKSIRLHQTEATALLAGAPLLPPLTLDAHPQLDPELTEWLADNRTTYEAIAKSIRNHVDELIKLEKTVITRCCTLVYASLSPTVQLMPLPWPSAMPLSGFTTNYATAISVYQRLHAFKFKPQVSLDVNLQAFHKMRTAVEKLEGPPLSDSHLASSLLAALPECIALDLFVRRGAQPSIPYKNMRQLLEQH